MSKDFILPDIGEGIVECEIIEWRVKEGDRIEEDQPVADVSTDKAVVEIPSMHSGRVVKLYYAQGEIARVHSPLFAIEIDGGGAESAEETVEPSPAAAPPPPVTTASVTSIAPAQGGKVLTTPAVRRLARENGLSLEAVPGTGKNGRILKEDVLNYLAGDSVAAAPAEARPS